MKQVVSLKLSWVLNFGSLSDKCNKCEKLAIRGGYLGEPWRAEHADVLTKFGRICWVHWNQNSRSWTNCEKKSVLDFQMKYTMITKRSLRKMFVFMQQMWENSWRWIQGDRRKKSFLDFTDENMWRTFMAARNEKM